jgi:transcriptional adapter 2-alpha
MDRVNFPLFDENWEAEEELLLLEAISKYGLGNWEDIADHVGTKTLGECRSHYFATYIDTPTFPLPDTSHVLTTTATLQQRKKESDRRAALQLTKRKRLKKASAAARSSNNSSNIVQSSKTLPGQQRNNAADASTVGVGGGVASSSAGANASNYASAPVSLDQAGFMPLRKEFEVEYLNDAEEAISSLVFDDEDTPDETEAKYKMLELYNRKLTERYKRRDFVVDRGLMNVKRLIEREQDLSRDERLLHAKLRVLIQVREKMREREREREREERRRVELPLTIIVSFVCLSRCCRERTLIRL